MARFLSLSLTFFTLLVFFGNAARVAAGEEAAPVAEAVRVPHAPVLDGTLRDPLWASAPALRQFRQALPETGAPATAGTEVRLLYDADHLYIGIRCEEPPEEILANDLGRDSRDTNSTAPLQGAIFESDDYVAVTLDTFGRRQEGYYFAVNPAGAWADGLVFNNETLDLSWDAVWQSRTARDATGWTAVLSIPFRSLAFDGRRLDWRVNFERMLRRRQEIVRTAAVDRQRQVYSLSETGRLAGLAGIRQGRGIELEPYVLYRHQSGAAGGLHAGADLVWHLLPSLAATLTLNTDFAQTDVDQRQVNLTHFPLFFAEKRDFFLRDEPFFSFGGINSTTFVPYYSRTIGLVRGEPADLPIGAKLAGRAGPLTLGILTTTIAATPFTPRRELSVGRLAVQTGEGSTWGVMFTDGDPRGPGANTLVGADYNLVSTTWIPGRTFITHAWLLATRSDAKGGSGQAASLELNYPNDPLNIDFFLRKVSDRFDPALGFVQLTGVYDYRFFVDRYWHPNGAVLHDARFGFHANGSFDLKGRDLIENIDLAWLTLANPQGDNLGFWLTDNADRPLKPFRISPALDIAPGFYRWLQGKVQLVTSAARPLSGVVYFRAGGFYEGTETEEKGSLVWRPNGHWNITAAYDLYQIRLPAGHFDVRNLSASLGWYWSPYLLGSVLAQFDTQSNTLGFNYRFQWVIAPRQTLNLVVNRGYLKDPNSGWRDQGGQEVMKLAWTWQF